MDDDVSRSRSPLYETVAFRVSRSLAAMIREHTEAAEREDGYNEFVETALRRSLLEGWDARHRDASYEQMKRMRGHDP